MKKHPRMEEAIKASEQAKVSNRGMYPYTLATNVFKKDGSTVEPRDTADDGEE